VYFIVEPDRAALSELAKLVNSGRLRTTVGRVFALADAAGAFDVLEHQHIQGKIVLSVRPEPRSAEGN
jgi:NADPH:quinone reductase-like Zn-dependent oxidoreductase